MRKFGPIAGSAFWYAIDYIAFLIARSLFRAVSIDSERFQDYIDQEQTIKESAMTDRSKLVAALRPFLEGVKDAARRSDIEEALDLLADLDIEIVPAETANKGVPKIRKTSRQGVPSVIANRGRIKSLKEADILMSVEDFFGFIGLAYEGGGRHAIKRRPAGAVLSQLEPTDPALVHLRTARREASQTVGGRRRLF